MRMIYIASALAAAFVASAAGPADAQTSWAQVFSHWGYTVRFGRAIATTDGGCVVVGYSSAFGGNWYDGWVGKLDADGKWQWQKITGGIGRDGFTEVIQTRDGGYLLAGYRSWESYHGGDGWCVRLDAAGRKLWERTFAQAGIERAVETVDGRFLLAGISYPQGMGFVELDGVGSLLSRRAYDLQSSYYDVLALRTGPDGATIVLVEDAILRIDSSGNAEWLKTYEFPALRYGGLRDIAVTDDGGYLVVGSYSEGGCAVMKLDSDGNAVWAERLDVDTYSQASGYQDEDGTFVIATAGVGATVARLDSSGQVLWAKRYKMSGDKRNLTVSPSTDGSIVLAASRHAYDYHLLLYSNGFAIRTASDGSVEACEEIVKPVEPKTEPIEVTVEVRSTTGSTPAVVTAVSASRVLPASVHAYDVCASVAEGGDK